MKRWGKVVTSLLLVIAAVFMALAYGVPEQRWDAIDAAAVVVAAALGVPFLVRRFESFTGDEELLAHGLPCFATITAPEPTRWRYNRYYPIVRFSLNVEAGGATYPVEIKQAVDPELLQQLAPATVVEVRVDRKNPKKVVINWRDVMRRSGDAAPAPTVDRNHAGNLPSFRRLAHRTSLTTVGVVLVILSLFFAALAFEERRYESQGVIVRGTAIGVNSKGKWTYKFTAGGRVLEGESEVLSGTASELKASGPVTVQYLSGSPDTNRIPGQRATYAGIALLLRSRRRRAR